MISLKNVSKDFNNTNILNDINLTINEGELVRIVGSNGCGKTTLLKIIAGLLKEDGGNITYGEGCNIGAVIENPSFIENETLLYNLKFLYNLKSKFSYDICKKYYIRNYTINPDGSIDVSGDVELGALNLDKIPLKFNIVSGYFNISNNNLSSLEGCPKYVGNSFHCSYNKI